MVPGFYPKWRAPQRTCLDSVWESDQRARAHELTLCQEAMTGNPHKTDKQWAMVHHKQTVQHERLADAHVRIKRHHHTVAAEVMRTSQAGARGDVASTARRQARAHAHAFFHRGEALRQDLRGLRKPGSEQRVVT